MGWSNGIPGQYKLYRTLIFQRTYRLRWIQLDQEKSKFGWGGRTRTHEWRDQNPLPYHLATPQK